MLLPPIVAAALLLLGYTEAPTATEPAVRVAVTVQVADPPPLVLDPWAPPEWAHCPQWWDTARQAGWPVEQMPTVDAVMWRESHCNAGAINPLNCTGSGRGEPHARGLMQLCGWSCNGSYAGCLDPLANLSRSYELWLSSGWRPWCYNDGITPRC